MKAPDAHQQKTVPIDSNYQSVLMSWLLAVHQFYSAYQQALDYVRRHKARHQESNYIGQCPVDELVKSLGAMHKQLETLLGQMNETDGQSPKTVSQHWTQLAAHTRLLARQTQLIQLRLALANQPTA